MPVPTAHVLYAIQTEAGIIDQITDQNLDQGIEEILQAGDGKVDPEFVATMSQSPVLSFTSPAIAKALAVAGINGLAVTTGVDFFFQQVAKGGTRTTGASHVKLNITDGLLIPRRLRATDGSEATIEYDLLVTAADDSNNPMIVTTDQALTGSPAETEKYVLGPIKIGSTLVNGITDTDIDFGISEMLLRSDGSVFNTFAAIMERRPQITSRTLNALLLDTFKTVEIVGAGSTTHPGQIALTGAAPALVSFWKVAQGGLRVNPTATDHVVFTINEGRLTVRSVSGTGRDPLETEAMITPTFDGTNDIMAISTAAALPA